MNVGAVGQSVYLASVLSATYGTMSKSSNAAPAAGSAKKDTATISNAAKELYAKGTSQAAQEEATETASQQQSEQASGSD